MMKIIFCLACLLGLNTTLLADRVLAWNSVSIQTGACSVKVVSKGGQCTEFVIDAFGEKYSLDQKDLKKVSTYSLKTIEIVENSDENGVLAYTVFLAKAFRAKGDSHDARLFIIYTGKGRVHIDERVTRHRRAP